MNQRHRHKQGTCRLAAVQQKRAWSYNGLKNKDAPNMRLSVRQEIITLFWPTLENPQLDYCGSIRENRDRLGRLKHSSQNDKRTQNCDLQAKAEEEGFVSSNKGEV